MDQLKRTDSNKLRLTTLEYTTLSQQVAQQLRDEIIKNQLTANTKLVESELSGTLGVSRTVVREAIADLVAEGLVVKAPNRYTMVTEYSPKDIQEIYDLRAALELAGARACLHQSGIVDRLIGKEQEMLAINRRANIDRLAFVYADTAFHTLIIEASENNRLLDAWSKIRSPLLRLLYSYVLTCSPEAPLGIASYDHGRIIRAFDAGDYHAVSKELMDHTTLMCNILLANMAVDSTSASDRVLPGSV